MILAHHAATPQNVWTAWTLEPMVLLGVVVAVVLYARGASILHRVRPGDWMRREAAFYGGLLALVVALVGPLDAAAGALFSAHMVQHLMLIFLAAPLLIAGSPAVHFALAMPAPWRRVWHKTTHWGPIRLLETFLRHALTVWCLNVVALWAWHLPDLYEAALRNEFVHALEHASFLGTALMFWAVVLNSSRKRLSYGASILFVFTTALQSGGLGALLTFAGGVLYPIHSATAPAWDLTALEDQQLAGALMWIPPGFIYLVVMATLFMKWMKDVERRMVAIRAGEP